MCVIIIFMKERKKASVCVLAFECVCVCVKEDLFLFIRFLNIYKYICMIFSSLVREKK